MLAINEVLRGRYRVIRQLGHGGMGAVYEAQDNVFDTTVALKEILIDLTRITTPKQQQIVRHAFEREAKILAMVKHEAFPHVRDYFIEGDSQYLVMELVDGEDLGSLLEKRQSPFPLANVLYWTDLLLDALDYLHTLNPPIIHRDIKPQNLKLTSRGKIKLLDFGIAKGADGQAANTTITNQTFVAATLNYSPLEQILRVLDPTFQEVITQRFDAKSLKALNQIADARSDLYALGATIYHLLTAKLPIDALKRTLEVWANKPDPLEYPSKLNPEIPREVSDWIMKAMEIEHDNRFASAVEMHGALQSALEVEKSREDQTIQMNLVAEQEKLAQERKTFEAERRRLEEEQKLQSDIKTQFLQEDEIKRQLAEQQRQPPAQEPQQPNAVTERNIGVNTGGQNPDLGATVAAFNQDSFNQSQQSSNTGQQTPPTITTPPPPPPPPSPFNYNQPSQQEIKPSDSFSQFPQPNQTQMAEVETTPRQANYQTNPVTTGGFGSVEQQQPRKKTSMLFWLIPVAGLFLLLIGGVVGAYLLLVPKGDDIAANNTVVNNSSVNANQSSNTNTTTQQPPEGMILVKGDTFTMGADKGDAAEMPAHQATVKSFFMDKYEVTREQYAKCVDAGKCTPPSIWKDKTYPSGTGKFPIVGVTFDQANEYAKWAGKRLPTEEEWEFAARGTDKRAFPWGGSWEKGKANANGESKDFAEVGKFSGTSPFGLYDMVGNAWEWTSSQFKAYPNGTLPPDVPKGGDVRVIRGGSYESTAQYASTTYRAGWLAKGAPTYAQTSFRCVKDAAP
jgi:serine/threonine protein kinase